MSLGKSSLKLGNLSINRAGMQFPSQDMRLEAAGLVASAARIMMTQ